VKTVDVTMTGVTTLPTLTAALTRTPLGAVGGSHKSDNDEDERTVTVGGAMPEGADSGVVKDKEELLTLPTLLKNTTRRE